MSHVVREGGFFIIFVARLSAIPGYVDRDRSHCTAQWFRGSVGLTMLQSLHHRGVLDLRNEHLDLHARVHPHAAEASQCRALEFYTS
jgi:hypothetical protein